MRVARLEVFGFKSFMERLVLPLDRGITGVVGPNGCGKSNIVDAIRWVLGETRAKNLRGDVLEDVIFNGTDKLKPLGLAEVTITLRASGENFFADLREVEEIEAELADLVEEPAEAAPVEPEPDGRPHLTVIQGNLGAEAAANQESAAPEPVKEREKAPLPTLTTRFAWLKAASEVQVTRRLYRSGESEFFINRVPCRLKDIKELFRAAGIGARAYTIVAQGEVSRVVSAKPEDRRLIIEEAAGVLGFRDRIAAAARRLEETNINVSRLDDIIREVSRQVSSLKRQAARARNRQELKEQISSIEKALAREKMLEISGARKRLEELLNRSRSDDGATEAALQRMMAEEHDLRNEMMSLDVQGDSARLSADTIREELGNRMRSQGERQAQLSETQALLASADKELVGIETRRAELEARRGEIQKRCEVLAVEESNLNAHLAVLAGETTAAEDDNFERLKAELQAREAELRQARDEAIAAQSSLEVLEEELAARSALEHFREQLKLDSGHAAKPLFRGVKVSQQHAAALEAVLGTRAGFIVSDDAVGAVRGFLDRRSAGSEGEPFGVVIAGNMKAHGESVKTPFPALYDLLEVESDCRFALSMFLKNVHFAADAGEAVEFFRQNVGRREFDDVVIVSAAGDIITPYSFSSFKPESGLIQLAERVEALRAQTKEFAAREAGLQTGIAELRESVRQAEERRAESLRRAQAQRDAVQVASNQLGSVRGRLESEAANSEQIARDLNGLTAQESECRERMERMRAQRETLLALPTSEAGSDDEQLKAELQKLGQEAQQLDAARRAAREKLSAIAARTASIRRDLDQIRAALSGHELEMQKLSLEEQNLRERVSAEYGAEVWEELRAAGDESERLSDEQVNEMREEAQRLRARVLREGEVDPTSIERFEEENARLEELSRQREDLVQAAATLKRTIERLTETSKRRFVTVFNAVRDNFSRLIPRLFGGGKGAIELLDPARPLETGVEITVRPPGKKPKNIDLLSGGEKALTATALIFSMFMERPSPLCVLDEVDAPLDEANLLRFLSLIREMSGRTQFLLITHNKQSMTLADHLVGVTMQEPGASKVISVSLNEAVSQVA